MARKRRLAPTTPSAAMPASGGRRPVLGGFGGFGGLVLLGLAAAAYFVAARRAAAPSLLLVTIDTLRADRVSAYGYGQPTTPVLDALAARGARFARAQSASPLTGPSHATILTGHYPPVHGVRDNVRFPIAGSTPTLAERLRGRGYETAAFVGAFPVAAAFGFGRGFSTYDEGLHAARPGQLAERPANEVADAAVAWLRARRDAPFFAWVHFYDPHDPYTPPPAERARFAHPYDGEVAFVDAQLGRLLGALKDAGLEARTLVAALSDHGEGLGEHGESTHGLLLHESTLRVPFVLAGPGVPQGRVVEERVGTIDALPTLVALLGLPRPEGLPGRDLRPALEGRRPREEPLYSESLYGRLNCRWAPLRALTEGDAKLVRGAREELYDLAQDPGELRERAALDPGRASRMRETLARAVAAMAPGGDRARPAPLAPAQAEALRALGYVAGGGGGGALDEPGLADPRDRLAEFERLRALGGARGASLVPALQEAAALARADPGNPFAHEVTAGLALEAGRLSDAAAALARFLALEPDRSDVRARRGDLLLALGLLEEAERELRRAIESAPGASAATNAAARTALAETLAARGALDEADALLQQVLAQDPQSRAALRARARLRLAQGRTEEAIGGLEEAARDGDVEALLELGEAYADAGRPSAARGAAERVLERSPAHPWALALAGQARVLEGRRADGVGLLERARASGPRRPRVWLRLAKGFEAAGLEDRARRCRETARAAGSANE